jgi:hypothetical protein
MPRKFSESAQASTDNPDTLCTMSALSVPIPTHPESISRQKSSLILIALGLFVVQDNGGNYQVSPGIVDGVSRLCC